VRIPEVAQRDGYVFTHWQEVGGTGKIATSGDYVANKDITFKAQYEYAKDSYKVSFYSAGLNLLGTYAVSEGGSIDLDAKLEEYEKYGVRSWYKAGESSPTKGIFTPTSDISFYAFAKVYEIRNEIDLTNVRNDLDGVYVVMNDIKLTSVTLDSQTGWEPIGGTADVNAPALNPFSGLFYGKGYKIKGLWINKLQSNAVGLFHGIDSAIIRDITVEIDAKGVNGQAWVGGIVGYIGDSGDIINAYVKGNVSGTGNYVGGIAGGIGGDLFGIIDSRFTGNVSGQTYVGGIAGYIYGASSVISNSFSEGSVKGVTIDGDVGNCVGGIVGDIDGSSKIINSYSTASVSGGSYVGGIAGSIQYSAVITNSYFKGSVSAAGDYAGGIAGSVNIDKSRSYNGGVSEITGSYAEGEVNGTGNYIGGIVGYFNKVYIGDSNFTGNVNSTGDYAGGIAGSTSHFFLEFFSQNSPSLEL
jgi:hypothetical protein